MSNRVTLKVLNADNKPFENHVLRDVINSFSESYQITMSDAKSEAEVLSALGEGDIDLVLLDIKWGTLDTDKVPFGLVLLDRIRASDNSDIPVIVVTTYELEGYQKLFLERGCDAFLAKKHDYRKDRLPSLEHVISKALKARELRKNLTPDGLVLSKVDDSGQEQVTRLFGTSEPMKKLFNAMIRIAAEPICPAVLLLGESGCGKSLIARMIHMLGDRGDGPFQEIVLNTIPDNLIESTLFGIESKAATGVAQRVGILELCDQGTLFLDEIGELPKRHQVKLLRALRDGKFARVGGNNEIEVSFQLITATNRNLESMVRFGEFRLDFYHRIRGVQVELPTLHDRITSVENDKIIRTLVDREMENRLFTFGFTDEAYTRLRKYSWPGNYAEFSTLLANLALECTTLIDSNMLEDRLVPEDDGDAAGDALLNALLNVQNHNQAMKIFRRKHIDRWRSKCGDLKTACKAIGIDTSTAYRLFRNEEEALEEDGEE